MFTRVYNSLEIKKAIECYDSVKSYRIASKRTGIGKSTIHRWYHSFHSLVIRQPIQRRKKRKRKPKYLGIIEKIKDLFTTKKLQYYSLKSIQQKLDFPNRLSLTWIRHCLTKSKVSRRRFQQSRVCPKSPSDLSTIVEAFHETINSLSNNEIVCIDETGCSNIGNTVYGYFNKGASPQSFSILKRQRLSVVMSILPSGVVSYKHQSKPFNSETFYRYIESLLPCLPRHVKVLLMDNVAFHKMYSSF